MDQKEFSKVVPPLSPSILGMQLGGKERASGVYTDINEHCERRSQQRCSPKGEGDS